MKRGNWSPSEMEGEVKRGKVSTVAITKQDCSTEDGTFLKAVKADLLRGRPEAATSILFFTNKETDVHREGRGASSWQV